MMVDLQSVPVSGNIRSIESLHLSFAQALETLPKTDPLLISNHPHRTACCAEGGRMWQGRMRGLAYMVIAAFLFSVMGVGVYGAALTVPPVAAPMVSFIRVTVNLVILVAPALWFKQGWALFGDRRASLWLRGLFGAVSLMLSFAAIQRIGPGESAFLSASSGVFVALLGPAVLSQRNPLSVWLAIFGSLAGLFLLFQPRLGPSDFLGRAMALGSGFLAALAYLMVARAGRSNPPQAVVFYFCLVAVAIHLVYFGIYGVLWPSTQNAWGWVMLAGISGSGAQLYMTRAYQMAPAALVSSVGYIGPVMSVIWGVLLFAKIPDQKALAGCTLVLLCGVFLPFSAVRSRAEK
jgi:S-adenosylmethionine uptake transporter